MQPYDIALVIIAYQLISWSFSHSCFAKAQHLSRCDNGQWFGTNAWMIVSLVGSRSHWILSHDDVIKWNHFPGYWPFVLGIHRSPVNSPHKGQWRGALMFSLICTRISGWVNNGEAGDLRRHRAHYDVIIMGHWDVISVSNNILLKCVNKGIHSTHVSQAWPCKVSWILVIITSAPIPYMHQRQYMVSYTLASPWWRHKMETFSALLALRAGNSTVTGEFPSQRPVTRSFGVLFDLRLSKQSWGWGFETPSCSLCRHWSGYQWHYNKRGEFHSSVCMYETTQEV